MNLKNLKLDVMVQKEIVVIRVRLEIQARQDVLAHLAIKVIKETLFLQLDQVSKVLRVNQDQSVTRDLK